MLQINELRNSFFMFYPAIISIVLINWLGIPKSQTIDFCELKGTVYIEEYPERANFFIYEDDSEAFADMLIYETDNALFATEPGVWYFTDQKGFADFSVYFVDSKGHADFTVYFTSFESFAGCNN